MPECMSMEKRIYRYAECFGIDPLTVEQKDIIELFVFQMYQNEQAWIMYYKTLKK